MATGRFRADEIDSADPRPGLYDPAPVAEAEAWFLPAPTADDSLLPPLPRAEQRALFDLDAWRQAQARCSAELAVLALRFGALDERLRAGPPGWRERLALMEVDGLGWWTGERIGIERLSLWLALRVAGVQDDSLALARAGWAYRRLSDGPGPAGGAAAFLGRNLGSGEDVAELAEALAGAGGLHPFVRAALWFQIWRIVGPPASRDIEAAVLAARVAAEAGRGGALFLPLALGGPGPLRASGAPDRRLASWLAGAEVSVLAALLHLDRLAAWRIRAETALADLSGRTPLALVAVLHDLPVVSAPMAEARSGASRAAVQRNLLVMQQRGLIREITGQGRYRVWAAQI